MCGIAGFIDPGARIADHRGTLARMIGRLVHRGPDAGGQWLDGTIGVALGHRRLSIVDLSAEGAQPMTSRSGRYVITYNGEVYNFQELGRRLAAAGHVFRGHSDTEVILALVEERGVPATVEALNGMFAFAIWDRAERRLWLVRDRIGKKPLYHGMVNGVLVFASELKAIRVLPGFAAEVDRDALTLYLRHNYVPAPWSIFRGIGKLEAGQLACFDLGDAGLVRGPVRQYWSASGVFDAGAAARQHKPDPDPTGELDALLRDAVRSRMVADVPLGAFLSGGIDSSLVVALMQAQSGSPVRTFTIGFGEAEFNEAEYARRIATHLGTDHTEIYVSPLEALEVIPRLPEIYDEPFGDSSQIPTYLVSRAARRHVTVALSGDGGDEGYCGYNRYVWLRQIWPLLRRTPAPLRRLAVATVGAFPAATWDRVLKPLSRLLPGDFRHGAPGEKLHKLAGVLGAESPDALYRHFVSHWKDPTALVTGGREPATLLSTDSGITDLDAFTDRMMQLDIQTYLPDDILVKVDRASMAVSLEVRAPLLDYRVLEYAAALPLSHKLKGTSGKLILRRILANYVPPALFERAKTGFGVPLEEWLRGPLRDWAEDLLTPARLKADGFFAVDVVRRCWDDLVQRGKPTHYYIWDILMFQAWLRQAEVRNTGTPALSLAS